MKSVLITGSNRGIGFGLVKAFVCRSNPPNHVFATCRFPAKAEELQNLSKSHKCLHVMELDVTNFESFSEIANEVTEIQPDGLNVLINNAGHSGRHVKLDFTNPKLMQETFLVNVVSPLMLTKALLPSLRKASEQSSHLPMSVSRAAIINISSILGSVTKNDSGGYYSYRASKSGLNAITKSLAVDLVDSGILTLALNPGWVQTRMGGPKAPLTVDEAVKSIVSTLESLSREHSGKFIDLDGSELPW